MDPFIWLRDDYTWSNDRKCVVKNGKEVAWEDVPEDIRHSIKLQGLVLPTGLNEVLVPEYRIYIRENEIAEQINEKFKNAEKPLLVVGVLKGAFIFMADLVRRLKVPHVVDFMAVSSYGDKIENDGNVRIIMDCRISQKGRDVLIVEDIVDSGYTLDYLVNNFKARGVNSITTATLLDKPLGRKIEFKPDYVGFELKGNDWVVGYGLDAGEKWRTLPYIATIKR